MGAPFSWGTCGKGCNLARWNAQAGSRENAVHDLLRAGVVLSVQGAAPASKFATQKRGLASGGPILMLSMKSPQEKRALLDESINSFCVCHKMHGCHPSLNRPLSEVNRANATKGRTS
jgi:hypothetical protein